MLTIDTYVEMTQLISESKNMPWPILLTNRDIALRVNTRIRKDIINHKLANVFELFNNA